MMGLPRKYYIDGVPFFKSELPPYYCTEASVEMIHKFHCERSRVTQKGIENRGARTYEGDNEWRDKGAEQFFKKLGYVVEIIDEPTLVTLKQRIVETGVPILLRMQHKQSGNMHTVVMVGYEGKNMIVHDPDSGPDKAMKIPNEKIIITSIMVLHDPKQCKMF